MLQALSIRHCAAMVFLGIALYLPLAYADVVRYTDQNGRTHYVSSAEQVPEEYRDQLRDAKPLPRITKIPTRDNTEATSHTGGPIPNFGLPDVGGPKRPKSTKSSSKVEVFVTDWCTYCQALEGDLKSRRIPYKRYNIERDAKGKKLYRELGGAGVPITRVGTTIVRGYDIETIVGLLK